MPEPWQGLRPDLRLHRGATDEWNQPTWLLEDPLSGRSFRIGQHEHKLLMSLIPFTDISTALADFQRRHQHLPTAEALLSFLQHLQAEHLARSSGKDEAYAPQAEGIAKHAQTVRQLMFWRIPLLNPTDFLSSSHRWLSWLWSSPAKWLWLLLGLWGLVRTLPQLELFFSSGGYLFTPAGAFSFVLCLAVLKACHELAHAFAAHNRGIYVPEIGVLLIIMWPVLYTNISQAWQLTDRRQRFAIDSAGVRFELAVAGLAILLWSFLPDGLGRNLCFFFASISVATSLFINLNPLMRFDGYYMLMDLWGIDNLQSRAFALLTYKQRRVLWDWRGEIPELHPQAGRMLFYAIACAGYRLLISLGISLAIYQLLHPLLGLIAFIAAMGAMVVQPIASEIITLWRQKNQMGKKWRVGLSVLGLTVLMAALLVPLPNRQSYPAVLVYENATKVQTPFAGELKNTLPELGSQLTQGQHLVSLSSIELDYAADNAEFEVRATRLQIASLGSSGEQGAYRQWLGTELARLQAQQQELAAQASQLQVVAPRAGEIVDVMADLRPGDTLPRGQYLLTVADPGQRQVISYVREQELNWLKSQAGQEIEVSFFDLGSDNATGKLAEQRFYPVDQLANPSLLDIHGGPIASMETEAGRIPKDNWYSFTFSAKGSPAYLADGTPCKVWLQGDTRSLLGRLADSIGQRLSADGVI